MLNIKRFNLKFRLMCRPEDSSIKFILCTLWSSSFSQLHEVPSHRFTRALVCSRDKCCSITNKMKRTGMEKKVSRVHRAAPLRETLGLKTFERIRSVNRMKKETFCRQIRFISNFTTRYILCVCEWEIAADKSYITRKRFCRIWKMSSLPGESLSNW